MRRRIRGIWLGQRSYEPVHRLQRALHAQRRAGAIGDTALLVEHEPVITLGRGGRWGNLLVPQEKLASRGIDLVETDRGGDITVHAPGQLVCYPIVDLAPDRRDVRRYVRDLAETMRRLALSWGVAAGTAKSLVGLWVDRAYPDTWRGVEQAEQLAKLGAIGVRLSRWVTMHGFAINLTTDLELFSLIVPCGIHGHEVTSIHALTGRTPELQATAGRALGLLAQVLAADCGELEDRSASGLEGLGLPPPG